MQISNKFYWEDDRIYYNGLKDWICIVFTNGKKLMPNYENQRGKLNVMFKIK